MGKPGHYIGFHFSPLVQVFLVHWIGFHYFPFYMDLLPLVLFCLSTSDFQCILSTISKASCHLGRSAFVTMHDVITHYADNVTNAGITVPMKHCPLFLLITSVMGTLMQCVANRFIQSRTHWSFTPIAIVLPLCIFWMLEQDCGLLIFSLTLPHVPLEI